MIPDHLLQTERLVFRELVESDWRMVHDYVSLEVVCRYQPWGPNTVEETKTYVSEVLADNKKNPRTRFMFAVVGKDDDRLIGAVELKICDSYHKCGEIGYIFHPDYWGIGIATEAAEQVLNIGFEHFHLHRIQATCDPNNIASSKVLEKIGMRKEGILRENLLIKSGWRDSAVYSVLETEHKL
ncbi:GNAT family N-acetyltransferase [Bacillus enclensis]|nr:GNAT family protein [[Bacillus] enclensis]MBH9965237.1 GNAT family N-acetyltransferase [[Bacillus] enclensis]